MITTFVYENEYSILDRQKRGTFQRLLFELKQRTDNDLELKSAFKKDLSYTKNKIIYKRKYYQYFRQYLLILGNFVSELNATYMPNTNMQRKLLKYSNNQLFFEKFTQHKEKVIEALSQFNLHNFTEAFNKLVTFYFAYSLFINEDDKKRLDLMFTYSLSYYLSNENLSLLAKEDYTTDQKSMISKSEAGLHRSLLFCLSLMNENFSSYDVLPRLQNKVYIDKTLI